MAVDMGDKVPDAPVWTMGPDGPQKVSTGEVLGSGKVVLFAVPGAYTPGCSKTHLPGFVKGADELLSKGVDKIACIAVNDAWVMDAWGREHGADDKILMLADGNGEFSQAMGLEMDASGAGLGKRSKRYAAVIEDGVITDLKLEQAPGVSATSCESVLESIQATA